MAHCKTRQATQITFSHRRSSFCMVARWSGSLRIDTRVFPEFPTVLADRLAQIYAPLLPSVTTLIYPRQHSLSTISPERRLWLPVAAPTHSHVSYKPKLCTGPFLYRQFSRPTPSLWHRLLASSTQDPRPYRRSIPCQQRSGLTCSTRGRQSCFL